MTIEFFGFRANGVLKKNKAPQQGVQLLNAIARYLFIYHTGEKKGLKLVKKNKFCVIKPWIGVIVNFSADV